MDLQKLSKPLLKSLVAVVVTLGDVATVTGSEGDVKLIEHPESLCKRLNTFTGRLQDHLQRFADTASANTKNNFQATPEPTRASVTSAASDWQTSGTKVVKEWIQMTMEAIEVLRACTATAIDERRNTGEAAKRAKDLQDKVDRWLNSLHTQVDETWQLPVIIDKDKADEALEEYENRVMEAKENTLEALKDMVNAMLTSSQEEGRERRAQRAENVLKPLGRLVVACGAATAIFQDLRRVVRAIQDSLEGTKESPDVPKDLRTKVAQVEWLWATSKTLVNSFLFVITGDILILLPGGTSYKEVAKKCQNAIKYIQSSVMSPQ